MRVRWSVAPNLPSRYTLSCCAMDLHSYIDLKPNANIPAFRPGDTVRVHAKVIEGERQRIQAFEGVVIRHRRGGINSNFTVRRISHGIGVERVFPYFSPLIDKVEVVRVGRVRRAKLYYLRERVGKAARIKAGSRARFEELTSTRGGPDYDEAEAMAEDEAEGAEVVALDEDAAGAEEAEEEAATTEESLGEEATPVAEASDAEPNPADEESPELPAVEVAAEEQPASKE